MTDDEEIVRRVVDFYRREPVRMAKLCDEEIDRSGALLGFVRSKARQPA